jgi:ComF family protein
MQLQAKLRQAIWALADVAFPPRCVGCGQRGERWCRACQASARRVAGALCPACARVISTGGCGCGAGAEQPLVALWAAGWFEGTLQQALVRLKYRRDLPLADTLAEWAAPRLASAAWPVDLIVPVPLAAGKTRRRGYNQAALLAQPLAERLSLMWRPAGLRRLREPRSQVGLSWAERQRNVAEAFEATAGCVAGRHVLVVDDTCTTGATLRACARALHQAGAASVRGFALAQARLRYTR